MAQIDIEILTPFAARFMEGTTLTPAERAEVLRIAQGFACKDSAAAAGVSPETIRARRKRIYRKLDVPGSGELLASLLALSLKMLAKGERIEPRPVTPTQPQAATSSAATVAPCCAVGCAGVTGRGSIRSPLASILSERDRSDARSSPEPGTSSLR